MNSKKLVKIYKMVLNINMQGNYTMFLNFYGHTDSLEIHYYRGEWADDKESTCICHGICSSDSIYDTEYLDYALSELEKLED